MNYFLTVFCKQMKMSSTKQKEICFYFKHVRSCNSRNNNQNNNSKNDHRPTEEIRSASSGSITEIVMTYQPHQPPKTFKFPETV